MIYVDLSGPQGNAFYLIGLGKKIGIQLERDRKHVNDVVNEMTAGDYDHLLEVFEREYGDFVEFTGENDGDEEF